jgi:HEAT repeat protein
MEMPGVRDVAIESLATAEAPGIEENLEKAYKVVDLSRRTAIIEIFARRNSPQLKPLLESGATDPIPEIRITIASVKGEAPKTEDLYLVATKGIIWMREKAIDRYLNAAEELVAAGKPDEARPLFENAAKTDFPAMVRIRALDGLAKTGTRDSLSVVMQCATEADLEAAAKAAEAAIAGRAGK